MRLHGFRPDILSIKKPSSITGAIYLHHPIPYLTGDVKSDWVKYVKLGDRAGYAQKVYGDARAPCSWDYFEGEFQAYSMKQAYSILWIKYEHMVIDVDLVRHSTPAHLTRDYDIVISSVPAHTLCMDKDNHTFLGEKIWITQNLPYAGLEDGVIVYSGRHGDNWYRCSKIFGYESTEYVEEVPDAVTGVKPIQTDCTCNPRFHRVGRFGQWRKGILAHSVFQDTIDILSRKEGIVDALF